MGSLALVLALVTVVVRVGLALGLLVYLDVTLLRVSRTMRRRQIVDVGGHASSRARRATEAWMVHRRALSFLLGTTFLVVLLGTLRAVVDLVLGVGG